MPCTVKPPKQHLDRAVVCITSSLEQSLATRSYSFGGKSAALEARALECSLFAHDAIVGRPVSLNFRHDGPVVAKVSAIERCGDVICLALDILDASHFKALVIDGPLRYVTIGWTSVLDLATRTYNLEFESVAFVREPKLVGATHVTRVYRDLTVATLRGVGGDILYCEEAAYMDLGVFYEVIVPLMEMRGAATICISTPVSTWNFYTELTEIRDDRGELLFDVIKVGMVCDRCAGTEHEADCTHPTSDRPEWKTETSEKVRAIYGHRKTLLMREVMGRVADDENMAFEVRDLKSFFKRKCAAEPHAVVDTLFVALDPNGGASGEGGTGINGIIVGREQEREDARVSHIFKMNLLDDNRGGPATPSEYRVYFDEMFTMRDSQGIRLFTFNEITGFCDAYIASVEKNQK